MHINIHRSLLLDPWIRHLQTLLLDRRFALIMIPICSLVPLDAFPKAGPPSRLRDSNAALPNTEHAAAYTEHAATYNNYLKSTVARIARVGSNVPGRDDYSQAMAVRGHLIFRFAPTLLILSSSPTSHICWPTSSCG